MLTPKDIADDLQVSYNTALEYIRGMPHTKLGGKLYRVEEKDYERWKQGRTRND